METAAFRRRGFRTHWTSVSAAIWPIDSLAQMAPGSGEEIIKSTLCHLDLQVGSLISSLELQQAGSSPADLDDNVFTVDSVMSVSLFVFRS